MSPPVQPVAWVTGAGGLIGSHLVQAAVPFAPGWRVTGLGRRDVDLTDCQTVSRMFREQRPRLIIHCAAMSRSPDCQRDPQRARQQNVEVTRMLTDLAAEAAFVFLSSDLVFDGRRGHYGESDRVNPLSVYAATKAEAETIVLANPHHLVIRTSLNAGPSPTGDRGLDEQLLAAWRTGATLNLFKDEFRCPIPAAMTARAIWELVQSGATGLFHVAGSERLSRWEIGNLLVRLHPDFKHLIQPGSLKDYAGAARSPDTSLNCAKAQAKLGFPLPKFSETIPR